MAGRSSEPIAFAAVTGDLVDSSAFPVDRLERAFELIDEAVRDISGWPGLDVRPENSGQNIVTGYARRGGDGWQLVLTEPAYDLRAALFVVARLRRARDVPETRIAVATGQAEGLAQIRKDPNLAHGPAFTASGRAVADMKSARRLVQISDPLRDAVFRLADHIARAWTRAQARALCEMLPPGSGPRRVVADRLGISRQAVDQALHSAGFPALLDALSRLEDRRP